ncbi:huntingtin-interacting protein K-like [Lineus longissimus]|uniref:huntingtin-interacting protein K-like n=1 Tax=Lineus longissimus TaxID=88925 RepID=UPI00315D91FE
MAGKEGVQSDNEEEFQDAPQVKKPAKHDSVGAADLEKVTDYAEEMEISSQSIGDAMRVMSDRKVQEANERLQRERELSKVKIRKEDVDLIVQEMEISESLAERKLREHMGNVVDALVELTQ